MTAAGQEDMKEPPKWPSGWLRQEIDSAIREIETKPYLSEAQRQSFRDARDRLANSDRIAR